MHIRPTLAAFFLGVFSMYVVLVGALRMRDLRWETEAFDHHCAVWHIRPNETTIRWAWLDDYYYEVIMRYRDNAHPTPTPEPTPWTTSL